MNETQRRSNGPISSNVLIIGSGIAGLSLALDIVERSEFSVSIVTKSSIDESNTKYAQGGIASVLSKHDNFDLHIEDTQIAGNMHIIQDKYVYFINNLNFCKFNHDLIDQFMVEDKE